MKKISFSSRLLVNGAVKLSKVIKGSYGPLGGITLIDKNGSPFATRDGAAICQEIYFENPVEEMGSRIVLDAAKKVEGLVGDGTSTTILLTAALLECGYKQLVAGYCPIQLCKELEDARDLCLEGILPRVRKASNPKNLKNAMLVSLHGDHNLASLITDAIMDVGKNGTISVEDGESVDDKFEIREGLELRSGWENSHFANTGEEYIDLDGSGILLFNGYLSDEADIIPALEFVSQFRRPLLIISHGVLGGAQKLMLYNKSKKVIDSCSIRAEGNKFTYLECLKDIQSVVGGEIVDPGKGMSLKDFNGDWIGFCRNAKVYHNKTRIQTYDDKNNSKQRILEIQRAIEKSEHDYDKDLFKNRIARLSGGYGVLKVGGYTKQEKQEKKSRLEDALLAAQACVDGGLIPGGGGVLVFLSDCLSDQRGGSLVLKNAFEKVFQSIFHDEGDKLHQLRDFQSTLNHPHPEEHSFSLDGKIINLWEAGLADPYLGLHHAIEKSISASCQVLRSCVTLHS